jgi:hypothetical protein
MMMKTGFGWVKIAGETYENDVVLHVDGSVSKRKKKLSKERKAEYGHTPLSEAELDFVNDERPDVVFIGTGQNGGLPITPEARTIIGQYEAVVGPTPTLMEPLEREGRRKIAILHVTC